MVIGPNDLRWSPSGSAFAAKYSVIATYGGELRLQDRLLTSAGDAATAAITASIPEWVVDDAGSLAAHVESDGKRHALFWYGQPAATHEFVAGVQADPSHLSFFYLKDGHRVRHVSWRASTPSPS